MFKIDTNRPVPAAIDGRKWQVAPAPGDMSGATDMRGARLFAPVTDTPTARMVRNHELAHAKITPVMSAATLCKRHSVSMEALQWAEDSRISSFLDRHELVDFEALTIEEAQAVAKVCAGSVRGIAGAFMVNWDCTPQRERLSDAFKACGIDPAIVDAIEGRVSDMRHSALSAARGGKRGRRTPLGKILGTRAGFKKFTIPLAKRFDSEFPVNGDGDARKGKAPPIDPSMERKLAAIKGKGRWGVITDVHRPRLSRAVRPRRSPGRRFADSGVIPSAVHRLPTDGAIFAAKRPTKGGTVLCDASGSMHYGDDDIERILQEAPGSTVAFYAGADGWKPEGRIVIGADRGRAATVAEIEEALPGCENKIDGPALRWLARQPAPRFWVSDEGVGGIDDFGPGGPCHAECLAICRAANITIVRRIDALRR